MTVSFNITLTHINFDYVAISCFQSYGDTLQLNRTSLAYYTMEISLIYIRDVKTDINAELY